MNLNNTRHYTYDNLQEQNQKEGEKKATEFLKLTNLKPSEKVETLKECKQCGELIKDDDDFCSPECDEPIWKL